MKKLAILRGDRNLTQKQLAEKTGISASSIAMYEIGERVPTLKRAKILADFFQVSVDYLFFANKTHEKKAKNKKQRSA